MSGRDKPVRIGSERMHDSFEFVGRPTCSRGESSRSFNAESVQAKDTWRLPEISPSFLDRRTICASEGNVNNYLTGGNSRILDPILSKIPQKILAPFG